MTTNTIMIKIGEVPVRLIGAQEDAFNIESDPWVVVGTTTIDGTRAQVAATFGCTPHGLGVTLAQAQGFAHPVGGRTLRVVNYDLTDLDSVVHCDIVRRQSEIDAEHKAHIDFVSEWAADPWRIRPTAMRQACPECGPHGNAGRVLLLESWADCTTCRPQARCPSGLCTGREEDGWCSDCDRRDAEAEYNDVNIRAGLKMVDEATPGVVQEIASSALAVGDKVRTRGGETCIVGRIRENEPRFLIMGIDCFKHGWVSTDEIRVVRDADYV